MIHDNLKFLHILIFKIYIIIILSRLSTSANANMYTTGVNLIHTPNFFGTMLYYKRSTLIVILIGNMRSSRVLVTLNDFITSDAIHKNLAH